MILTGVTGCRGKINPNVLKGPLQIEMQKNSRGSSSLLTEKDRDFLDTAFGWVGRAIIGLVAFVILAVSVSYLRSLLPSREPPVQRGPEVDYSTVPKFPTG